VRRLSLLDTSLRDGQKSLGINLNVNEKLEISRQLVKKLVKRWPNSS
jgi:isopropylmalate/homocitrate/citramalate synthase